jgi:hypothetical protein
MSERCARVLFGVPSRTLELNEKSLPPNRVTGSMTAVETAYDNASAWWT